MSAHDMGQAEMDLGPVRVAFDHRIFVSQTHGGISRYFARVADELPLFGISSRIIAPLHFNAYLRDLPKSVFKGVRVPDIKNPKIREAVRLIDTALLPSRFRRFGGDIMHETYYSPRRIAPKGVKVALSVFDMIHELYPDEWEHDPTASYKKRAVRDADLIFCISQNTRKDLLSFYPEAADKTVVTLLGFDSPDTKIAGELPTDHKMANTLKDKQFILYVGLRNGYKNFARMLSAFAEAPRLRKDFDILCVGGGSFSADERNAIDAVSLTASIHQVDADDNTLRSVYRQARLFVYPSLYEGFGLPPLEAMAADCPVAASNSSSIPEVCGDAAEYFDPMSAESIATAMENVLYSSDRSETLRRRGADRLKSFSWTRCAEQMAASYRGLVA